MRLTEKRHNQKIQEKNSHERLGKNGNKHEKSPNRLDTLAPKRSPSTESIGVDSGYMQGRCASSAMTGAEMSTGKKHREEGQRTQEHRQQQDRPK